MAATPVVRDLNGLINTIGQSVNPLKAQYDADILANETAGQAQIAGLDAKKVSAFKQIEQGAQNKNMFFSGFAPNEEAEYTADSYLPALAALQQTIASTRSGLMKEKLGLDRDVFNKAFDTQQQDKAVLDDWNKMTAQQQFDASEADKQRVFTAQQNEADRNVQRSEGAANRAASAARSGGGGGGGSASAPVGDKVRAMLSAAAGTDGKVSPGTWKNIAAYAADNGLKFGGKEGFANKYWNYANDKHYKDYQVGYEKYM